MVYWVHNCEILHILKLLLHSLYVSIILLSYSGKLIHKTVDAYGNDFSPKDFVILSRKEIFILNLNFITFTDTLHTLPPNNT